MMIEQINYDYDRGCIEIFRRGRKAKKYYNVSMSSLTRLERIVNDLIGLGRADAGATFWGVSVIIARQ